MAICARLYPDGKQLKSKKGMEGFEEAVAKEVHAIALMEASWAKPLSIGDHELPLGKFTFRRCDYTLRIHANGTGVLYATIRTRDVITKEAITEGEITIERLKVGDQTYLIPEDRAIGSIVGPNNQRKLCLWAFFFYSVGTKPEDMQNAVNSFSIDGVLRTMFSKQS